MANIYERDDMITFDEFRNMLQDNLRDSLKHFPKVDVEEYIKSEFAENEVRSEYGKCVERFKESELQYPNEVFSAGMSRLDNLLTMCFE